MRRPGAPVLDERRIGRWGAAAVPWWVPRVVLLLGWVAAVGAAVAGDSRPCSTVDPLVCGPDVTFAVALVVLLATPVLLWWLPLAGCAAGIAFAVADLVYDDVPAANVAFAIHALLCLAVAVWLVAARRRQAGIVAEVAGTVRLDSALAERLRDSFPGWGGRTLIAAVLVLAGAGGLAWYGHRAGQVVAHESAAVRVDAVVRSADNDEGEIVVEVPQPVRVGVLDPYEAGQVVPVLVDGSWVRPVAEPEDVTGWLSAGLGALALAALLLVREQRMRSARRRLLSGELPAVELTAEPDAENRAVLAGDMALVPVVASPLTLSRPHLTGEDVDWADGWGGPAEPQTVTVAGDLRDGGWVLLVTDDAVLLPEAPLRTPRNRPEMPEDPPGEPLPDTDPGDLPELPVVLRMPPRDRVFGALLLLGFAAAPALVLTGLTDGWWDSGIVLWVGGLMTYGGWDRLNARVRLTRGGLVVHDRWRVHHVPWHRLREVRRDDKGLWLEWEPDVTFRMSGVDEHWGPVMMRLRDLSLAAGDPGGDVTGRLSGGLVVGLAYLAVVAVALFGIGG
ncbi:hypothetical protein JIG36_23390 [Actinoplanes sp. LDG1-06]|uniref:PH domain-containing protein n=1 Tax=Paractinoplanes ovalisporus TaxID=2810368 RepID=A0ABS2AF96_9ACTN|nr:hypothetical protein [Actinoplanes ovalisporus]MBM2618505.1 hypothetical protein [Actinoplanes ovalisporus]